MLWRLVDLVLSHLALIEELEFLVFTKWDGTRDFVPICTRFEGCLAVTIYKYWFLVRNPLLISTVSNFTDLFLKPLPKLRPRRSEQRSNGVLQEGKTSLSFLFYFSPRKEKKEKKLKENEKRSRENREIAFPYSVFLYFVMISPFLFNNK